MNIISIILGNLIVGLMSLIKYPDKRKIAGLVFPLTAIIIVLSASSEFKEMHPVICWVLFWCSIPVYLIILGGLHNSKIKNPIKKKPSNYHQDNNDYCDNDNYEEDYSKVNNNRNEFNNLPVEHISHIEERTKNETSRIIYFRNGEAYHENN